MEEIKKALETSNLSSTSGWDGISYMVIKKYFTELGPLLVKVTNECMERGELTPTFKLGLIKLIPKKGDANKIDREIHTGVLRAYGVIPATQFDFDGSYNKQWGNVQRKVGDNKIEVDHDAHAYNIEIGYNVKHPWKPRFSTFYGVATGDQRSGPANSDTTPMERFERLFGFARPWSNDDYIQMENIRTNKVRLEFDPKISFLDNVKVDTGFSWYRLDSATDQWNAGGRAEDRTGSSGRDLGKEYDLRVRFPFNQYASLNLGYAYFWGGDFIASPKTFQNPTIGGQNRSSKSEFFYAELTLLGF